MLIHLPITAIHINSINLTKTEVVITNYDSFMTCYDLIMIYGEHML